MLQLNLLPDVKKEFLRAQRMRNLVVTVCIFASIVSGAVVVALSIWLGSQVLIKDGLTRDIQKNYNTIQSKQEDENLNNHLTIQNQLNRVVELRENRLIYSRLMDIYLPQLNLEAPYGVQLDSVQIGDGEIGSMAISGSTATFATLDNYQNALINATIRYSTGEGTNVQEARLFTSVVVTPSWSPEMTSFSIALTFNEVAFQASTKLYEYEPGIYIRYPYPDRPDINTPIFNTGTRGQQ